MSVRCGPDTCGWRMRMGKCGWKNAERSQKKVKRIKREKRTARMNKQTNERNFFFKSLSRGWVLHVQNALSIVETGYSRFFVNSLNAVIPSFINVTETRTLHSSSLKPRCYGAFLLWVHSLDIMYSTLQKRKCFQGNREFFVWVPRDSIKKQKGAT